MGHWRDHSDVYGRAGQQEWVPEWYERPGYWQADKVRRDGRSVRRVRFVADQGARKPDWPQGAPEPCQVCHGHLIRWPGRQCGHDYEIRHYRGPHAVGEHELADGEDPWEQDGGDLRPRPEVYR